MQSTQKALGNTNCTSYQCDYQNLLANMKKIQRYLLLNTSHISLNFMSTNDEFSLYTL